jgi:hypothetical protein
VKNHQDEPKQEPTSNESKKPAEPRKTLKIRTGVRAGIDVNVYNVY